MENEAKVDKASDCSARDFRTLWYDKERSLPPAGIEGVLVWDEDYFGPAIVRTNSAREFWEGDWDREVKARYWALVTPPIEPAP